MNITLQYFDSCPNWKVAEDRVKTIIEETRLEVDLEYQLIVDLNQHPRPVRVPRQASVNVDHRRLDQIRGGAL